MWYPKMRCKQTGYKESIVPIENLMQLTRAADYAVRVMIHLAALPPGGGLKG